MPSSAGDLLQLLGTEFAELDAHGNARRGKITKLHAGQGGVFGVYFAAAWSAECAPFTARLLAFREALQTAGRPFDVVLVPRNRDAAEFERHFAGMPWLSVPQDDSARIEQLCDGFRVEKLPHLAFVDDEGFLLTNDGCDVVARDLVAEFPFRDHKAGVIGPRNVFNAKRAALIFAVANVLVYAWRTGVPQEYLGPFVQTYLGPVLELLHAAVFPFELAMREGWSVAGNGVDYLLAQLTGSGDGEGDGEL